MKILITGGAGFLGKRLAAALMARGTVALRPGDAQQIRELTLVDTVAGETPADPRVRTVTGDIADRALLDRLIDRETGAIFHLAAIVSGMAEAEFDTGMRINLDATRSLLEVCRAHGHRPRIVFTSSVAVYGGRLPEIVTDDSVVNPQTSYGTQKAIGELLISDYSRKGFVDGRALRLPTVSVRPGRPNAAASSFASGIIREPLNGEDAVCPVDDVTRVLLISPRTVTGCLIAGLELPSDAFRRETRRQSPGIVDERRRNDRRAGARGREGRLDASATSARRADFAVHGELAGRLGQQPGTSDGLPGRRELRRRHPGTHQGKRVTLSPSPQLASVFGLLGSRIAATVSSSS
jgi:nucleoside-diphosphate-sugar epimerase